MSLVLISVFVFSSNGWTCLSQQTPKENDKDVIKSGENNSQERLKYTNEDKSQMIKSILEQTSLIKKRTLPDWAEEKLVIKISEKNIDAKLLPKFPQVEFALLSEDDIKNHEEVSINYWEFEYFRAEKYKIIVYFSITNAGRGFFPSKYKTTYECREEKAKWFCKAVGYAIHN